jgi:hypothetical protein
VPTTLRCLNHLEAGDIQAYAEEYAVASVVYYSGFEYGEFMSDARFDALCQVLLARKVYMMINWIDRESLIAGTGYDTKAFPDYIHDAAREWAESPAG